MKILNLMERFWKPFPGEKYPRNLYVAFWLAILFATLGFVALLIPADAHGATFSKQWDFTASREDWEEVGGGGVTWRNNLGDGEGGFGAQCTSTGIGCSFSSLFPDDPWTDEGIYLRATWENIGVPATSTITKILISDGTATTSFKAIQNNVTGNGFIDGMWLYDVNQNNYWLTNYPQSLDKTAWTTYEAQTESGTLNLPSSDLFYLVLGYSGSKPAGSLGTKQVKLDEVTLVIEYEPTPVFKPEWLIATAYAATDCTFVTSGATTTTSCTDPLISNPTQDIGFGIMLFFGLLGGTILFLELRQRKFND